MKKIKKLLAMIMAMTMVLGMAMTVSAAPDDDPTTSNITVSGLAAEDDDTTVQLYPAIRWRDAESRWIVSDWASQYIELKGNTYEITDDAALSNAASGTPSQSKTLSAGTTEVTFEDVPVGAYVIIASGEKATYSPMVAETYKQDATYMEAEDVTVYAKTSGYELTKEQKVEAEGGKFIARGEKVTFTITTTFPTFNWNAQDNEYKIIDTPDGLRIDKVNKITIGGTELQPGDYEAGYDPVNTAKYVIDLSTQIKEEFAGKRVIIEYEATVTADDGYSNTANAWKDDKDFGSDIEEGYTGSITIQKFEETKTTGLEGAEFKVYHATKDEVGAGTIEALYFIKVEDGVYKKALDQNEVGATQTIVTDQDGKIKVTGLDEGNYWFEETKAPKGYSINTEGISAKIDLENWEGNENISIGGDGTLYLLDTKLASLPSTGGIGTTIFTIGGCAIMIAAAALYFVNRRKSEEN